MNKCKIIKRRGVRKLLIKGMKGQQISEWETNAINTGEVPGLLPVEVAKKGFVYNLEYDITGFLTFREFLQVPLSKEIFARLMDNILQNLKAVEEKHFNQQLVIYDMDMIYINPSTQRLFFAYVPLQPFENENTLQNMLREIIDNAAFDEAEDSEYVAEYIAILNRGINFSVFDLEEYVRKLIREVNGEYDGNTVECPRCHMVLPADAVLCNCGFKLRGYTGETRKSQVYDMFKNYTEQEKPIREESMIYDPLGNIPEDTVKHIPEEQEQRAEKKEQAKKKKQTTVLSLYNEGEEAQVFLIRKKTKEQVRIEDCPFRIGRESGDYIVENKFISDPHMEIVRHGSTYYAVDLGSTNRSYLNGERLPADQEVELSSGCWLKLANEEFEFIIE